MQAMIPLDNTGQIRTICNKRFKVKMAMQNLHMTALLGRFFGQDVIKSMWLSCGASNLVDTDSALVCVQGDCQSYFPRQGCDCGECFVVQNVHCCVNHTFFAVCLCKFVSHFSAVICHEVVSHFCVPRNHGHTCNLHLHRRMFVPTKNLCADPTSMTAACMPVGHVPQRQQQCCFDPWQTACDIFSDLQTSSCNRSWAWWTLRTL